MSGKGNGGKFWAALLTAVIVAMPVLIYGGLIVAHLWQWFIVPLGVRRISMIEGAGLLVVTSLLLDRTHEADSSPSDVIATAVGRLFSMTMCFLFALLLVSVR